MTYSELISFCNPMSVQGRAPETLGNLRNDSRSVKQGDIFIAIRGLQVDGHSYLEDALERGASVLITEEEFDVQKENVAVIVVQNTRNLLSPLAQKMAGDPAKKLRIIGITGTNGKTTVATLVWQALRYLNQPAALLGTVSKRINDEEMESRLTTADPIELADDMNKMVKAGCTYLVMEVSSHALHQGRVIGIDFEVAAFTNLSHDHLDYHSSMEEYAATKKILFDNLSDTSWAVINADDRYAGFMVDDTQAKVLDISLRGSALINAIVEEASAEVTIVGVEGVKIHSPLVGQFNASNIVQALIICTSLGFDGRTVAEQLSKCKGAEGRMERVSINGDDPDLPIIFVDYAHTPDALENVASTLAGLKSSDQQLTVIFGCGGDRDRTKRPKMAAVAEKYADHVTVTSDNPRSEDPDAIIHEVVTGFSDGYSYNTVTSRKDAIHTVISDSDGNDIILIAGKGHETYQEINGNRVHFDDREEASTALSWKRGQIKNSEVY
ncbi:UDP-N-acetylmuramoyl-L-alanyl-D-glutamate--2,6-diaminopimelate ligase [Rhodohalobacter mucosus]|uniref:UDP-N-acetylmuramoyl-L-alanyl-D-glutamate--2,6-diaminopimelate ligase n=1 Tax=Rhodohalobacter mucosus TaxID=2079485 RepID=A0A316TRB7_9BACT|nr:UDP-N-acetylmuramoyl-L-alanyl-D-glutamate--2,6-diaminopimelate ligase [Rhodohalobacter mucosus]PWN06960.1 UDP-N-acetylmuramoyl-L-alanyl-D-glutamate--2,6-diaminopimelate ligase [Rhodohalobacter mucosus]